MRVQDRKDLGVHSSCQSQGQRLWFSHQTHYLYDRLVELGQQTIALRPAPHCQTPILSYSLQIEPEDHYLHWQQDPYGNFLAKASFKQPTKALKIHVEGVIDLSPINPFDFFYDPQFESYPFSYDETLEKELSSFLEVEAHGKAFKTWIEKIKTKLPSELKTNDFLVGINQEVFKTILYKVRLEPGVQSAEETLEKQSGSCRDMAWLLCQTLRELGIASRFCSGYLIQLKDEHVEKDHIELHAWCELYVPGAGWIGLDPTSGYFAAEGHLPLCSAASPALAAPIRGCVSPSEATLEYHMEVKRLDESPSLSENQSAKTLDELGSAIDMDIKRWDLRLTQGGEPTFVDKDDRESQQWQVAAIGKEKNEKATLLLREMYNTWGHQGMLHYGQGKWYPGETLPRWAYSHYFRKDGQPIWEDKKLLGAPTDTYTSPKNSAELFMQSFAKKLGLEKATLPAVFEKDPQLLQGFVLPLAKSKNSWRSCPLSCGSAIPLIEGDSALGYRLPLDTLNKPYPYASTLERSLFEKPAPLKTKIELLQQLQNSGTLEKTDRIHSCFCTELRDDKLYLFMPPLLELEAYLSIIHLIEEVAQELNLPVIIEGYPPPKDLRLSCNTLTPDPGVLEVNTEPAESWPEIKKIQSDLFQMAQDCGLCSYKYLLDGKEIPGGGGNHIVLGGKTPKDSPFLRKPDLLRSMLTYWQHHPCLSYLFASHFIGPHSQSPRIDEAHHYSLYELEIAFKQIPEAGPFPAWLTDRLFRHLLVDLTGNTHRAEFCIDKLFNPDSEMGRLGLLELRAFEMPKTVNEQLALQLLVRALVVMLWKDPYHHPFKRLGTHLHDRYLLPHFLEQDFQDVLRDLHDFGYDFPLELFQNTLKQRFPLLGSVKIEGVEIELKMALEPWPILGEELHGSSVSRGVDTAIERVQVHVKGKLPPGCVLCVGEIALPLQAISEDESVIGIRYKAWETPLTLHPNIKKHVPLIFSLVNENKRVCLGGFRYHSTHPAGRSYDHFPLNEAEAKARMLSRFEPFGPQGAFSPRKVQLSSQAPLTLDLRAWL